MSFKIALRRGWLSKASPRFALKKRGAVLVKPSEPQASIGNLRPSTFDLQPSSLILRTSKHEPDAWLSLAVQIPIVVIFVWFSLQLISSFLKSIETVTASFVKSIDARDAAWREFFYQYRDATINTLNTINTMATRFSDEVRLIGKQVSELSGKLE